MFGNPSKSVNFDAILTISQCIEELLLNWTTSISLLFCINNIIFIILGQNFYVSKNSNRPWIIIIQKISKHIYVAAVSPKIFEQTMTNLLLFHPHLLFSNPLFYVMIWSSSLEIFINLLGLKNMIIDWLKMSPKIKTSKLKEGSFVTE